jgi:hypothetical protein
MWASRPTGTTITRNHNNQHNATTTRNNTQTTTTQQEEEDMSSTNKTAELGMHAWVRTDPVRCEDFNENFSKIDDAVRELRNQKGICKIYTGSYVGVGGYGSVTLNFPTLPEVIYFQIADLPYQTFTVVKDGARIPSEVPTPRSNGYAANVNVKGNTVTITPSGSNSSSIVVNLSSCTYYYVALAIT